MSGADELLISFFFPPSRDVAGMLLAKRYLVEGKKFDVIQSASNDDCDWEFKSLLDEYINEQILIDVDCNPNFTSCIFEFVDKSLQELDKRQTYNKISSIVWKIANSFLALEYKFRHPDVYWQAEFTDPIIYDIYNKRRVASNNKRINDESYIEKLNRFIHDLNSRNCTDFETVEKSVDVYFLVEYITFLFADEIVFTNENQQKFMLSRFCEDVRDFVLAKSVVKHPPILPKQYYMIKDYKEDLDSDMVNIAYFGNVYSKRNFEVIYHAFEVLNHRFKSKLQFYFYLNDKPLVERLIEGLEISDNIHLKDTVDHLDYLNLTTKFDVLIVNDLITSDCFEANPYLPSKLSEYLGSGSDIWAIYEKGSTLEKADVKYKSDVHDFTSNVDVLVRILEDYSYSDDEYTVKDSFTYFQNRLTHLNVIIDDEHIKTANANNRIRNLKREISKLKKKNSNVKDDDGEKSSSDKWNISKSFKKLSGSFRK